jgi:hypothetical protein
LERRRPEKAVGGYSVFLEFYVASFFVSRQRKKNTPNSKKPVKIEASPQG